IQKERGSLALELETGRSFRVSDKPMIHRLHRSRRESAGNGRTRYRLRLINDAQEANAAGAAGDGPPAASTPSGRPSADWQRKTPAAR
ncbi:MAG: hypothetical protein V3S01_04770, partial [Dehalococcoidia bacterium]